MGAKEAAEAKSKDSEGQGASMRPIEIALLVLIFILISTDAVGVWMIGAFLPSWLDDNGLDSNWAGFIFAANAVGGLLATFAAPFIIQTTSNTSIIVSTPVVICCTQFLTAAITPNVEGAVSKGVVLLSLRALAGLAEGLMYVSSGAVIIRVAPENQGPAYLGMSEGVRALGILLGPLVGSPLFTVGGFPLPFIVAGSVLAISSAFLTTCIWFLPPEGNHSNSSALGTIELSKKINSWQTSALLGTLLIAMIPGVIIQPILEPYLINPPFNLQPASVGVIFGACSVIDILGASASGAVCALIGAFPVLYGCNAISVLGSVLLFAGPEQLVVVTLALCCLYLGGYPTFISGMIIFQRYIKLKGLAFKDYSELTATTASAAVYIAFIVGTSSGGALNAVIGFRDTFIVVAGVTALIFPIMIIAFHPSVLGAALPEIDSEEAESTKEENPQNRRSGLDCLGCKGA